MKIAVNHSAPLSVKNMMKATLFLNHKIGAEWRLHEQRSLSERLHREQGINTKDLLGHKSQQQIDKYHDDRGKDWIKIVV
jgi:hypothetical protein